MGYYRYGRIPVRKNICLMLTALCVFAIAGCQSGVKTGEVFVHRLMPSPGGALRDTGWYIVSAPQVIGDTATLAIQGVISHMPKALTSGEEIALVFKNRARRFFTATVSVITPARMELKDIQAIDEEEYHRCLDDYQEYKHGTATHPKASPAPTVPLDTLKQGTELTIELPGAAETVPTFVRFTRLLGAEMTLALRVDRKVEAPVGTQVGLPIEGYRSGIVIAVVDYGDEDTRVLSIKLRPDDK